ncbi:MAG: glycoside hydrolase family 9 protein [Brucellaceae bacterium]|nr:glycoside hydrolase family 9 protein [Brucellaceae bacterium]
MAPRAIANLTGIAMVLGVVTADASELVANPDFADGKRDWWTTSNLTSRISADGLFCADVPGGTANPWDAIIGQDGIRLDEGKAYRFTYTASGEPGGPVRALVQMPTEPYTFYVELNGLAGPQSSTSQRVFVSPETRSDAQVVMQLGGSAEPWTACFELVSLDNDADAKAGHGDTGPRIRVNQVGYLPDGPRRATLVTESRNALPWRLLAPDGAEIASGETEPRGIDASAGVNVHTIDFSRAEARGKGFAIEADGETSYPFAIEDDVYASLARDAMSYFYLARSGIAIEAGIVGDDYARPAGHVAAPGDGEVNRGDRDVPCMSPDSAMAAYGEPWTCGYTLDVAGGWYDAGDHGKYVVNGGISVAQLMGAYERALVVEGADRSIFADGALPLPEHGNGVPDLLDEARWELDFMMRMVVPDGETLAGMAHHKIHDDRWTGIPLLPHEDDRPRALHRPSTAATLNLAAAAAQGARLFEPFDAAYARKLLGAARKAYAAAKAHPDLYAPGTDNVGGGPYDDQDVSDEFYWAAAELYVTTGEGGYLADLEASRHWRGEVFGPGGFDWANVAALGRLTLATVPSTLPDRDRRAARQSIVDAADRYLDTQAGEPFGQPYAPPGGRYDWGSNHLIVQNAIVMARAYDFTKEPRYRDGVLESLDYLFGRNALNIAYVTGYGTVYAKNQHSRWFANQADPSLPHPPKGSLAGGPNSSLVDPVAQRTLEGCAPQTCYVDDIESFGTNEITINWNAALAELAAFVSEQ